MYPGNIARLRDFNRDAVLALVERKQPLSRADIARLSGLQKSTVGEIVSVLLREQVITEELKRATRGRPPLMLTIGRKLALPVVDLDAERAQIAVMDLAGNLLAEATVSVAPAGKAFLARLTGCLRTLQQQHHFEFTHGVALTTSSSSSAPQPALADEVAATLSHLSAPEVLRVRTAEALLLAQLRFGPLEGIRHAVQLHLGATLEAAILIDGRIVQGRAGRTPGFAHICLDAAGPVCCCGRAGCWAALASPETLLWLYRGLSSRAPRTLAQLLKRADAGDSIAVECMCRYARYLAEGLRVVIETMQPEVILLSGQVATLWPRLESCVTAHLDRTGLDRTGLDRTGLDRTGLQPPPIRLTDGQPAALFQGAAVALSGRHTRYASPDLVR